MDQPKQTRSFSKFRLYLTFIFGIVISIVIGVGVFVEYPPDGNSDEKIEDIEDRIAIKIGIGQEMTWTRINDFGYGIDSTNRDIAIAKVMMELSEPPKSSTSLNSQIRSYTSWMSRVELSQKKWKMYKLSDHYIKCVLIGAGSSILTIPGVWFALGLMIFIIRFIWDFFLARITEISDAVKGKKETRSN